MRDPCLKSLWLEGGGRGRQCVTRDRTKSSDRKDSEGSEVEGRSEVGVSSWMEEDSGGCNGKVKIETQSLRLLMLR